MAKIRHTSRVIALQALVAITVSESKKYDYIFLCIQKEFAPELAKFEFSKNIFIGVIENRSIIDEDLQKLATRWPIDKLSSIERCILEIGAYELLFMPETPYAVILDEAVELAKEFGDDTASSFINGVLSSFAKEVRKKDIAKKNEK